MDKIKFKTLLLIMALIFPFINCKKDDKKDNTGLMLALLLMQPKASATAAVTAEYPNTITGTTADIKASSSASAAVSSAVGPAVSSASSTSNLQPAASIIESIRERVIQESVQRATICDGTTKKVTASIKNTGYGVQSSTFISGSYSYTVDLTVTGTINCPTASISNLDLTKDSSGTTTSTLTTTGSITMVFVNAKFKVFDVEAFVKNGTFQYNETTLNGEIKTTNINNYSVGTISNTYTAATKKNTSANSFSQSLQSKSAASALYIDSSTTAVSFSLDTASKTILEYSSTVDYSSSALSYCTNSFDIAIGGKTTGTYNNNQVSVSYSLNKDNYIKQIIALNGKDTTTYCK